MARKQNIIIIGAGLFGSAAARLARAEGHTVTVVDTPKPYAASKASGCVLAPSWLQSLTSTQREEGMAVLQDLVPVYDIEFQTNLIKTFKAKRINKEDLLVQADLEDDVVKVEDGLVVTAGGSKLRGVVLVAAGMGTAALVAGLPAMKGLWGASLTINGQLGSPRLSVYAPYRQAVAFNVSRGKVWMGDGSALSEKTWEKEQAERVLRTKKRAADLFELANAAKASVFTGARPYVDGHKAGYFNKVAPKLYVSTGGAKNGTLLAAVQALEFARAL